MVKREQDEAYQASLRQDRAKVRFQLCTDNFLSVIKDNQCKQAAKKLYLKS